MLYLSPTDEGKTHEKALLDTENLACLPGITLGQDTGYRGYRPDGVPISEPTKKPRGGELSDAQKETNQAISKERLVVEDAMAGIKRVGILKERIRLHCYELGDRLIKVGCALQNLRVKSPDRAYSPRTGMWA